MISINELSVEQLEHHIVSMDARARKVLDIIGSNSPEVHTDKYKRAQKLLHSIHRRMDLVWDKADELDPQAAE